MDRVQDLDLLKVKNGHLNMPGDGRSSRKKRVVVVHNAVEEIFGSLELGLILDSGYYLDPVFFVGFFFFFSIKFPSIFIFVYM